MIPLISLNEMYVELIVMVYNEQGSHRITIRTLSNNLSALCGGCKHYLEITMQFYLFKGIQQHFNKLVLKVAGRQSPNTLLFPFLQCVGLFLEMFRVLLTNF